MTKWFYVQGSERIGPVEVEKLKDLYLKKEINYNTYIWRKGFQGWEHLKNINELNFDSDEEVAVEKNSLPTALEFNWKNVSSEEELFFVKVGNDRSAQLEFEFFGPYSLNELNDALKERRINNQSLIFAAGMLGWVEIGDTPLNPRNLKINENNISPEAPLFVVVENVPSPLIALVSGAGVKKCTLLGAGHYQSGKIIMCSMYLGNELKAKNLKLKINEYKSREQKILCDIVEINEVAKKIMQNHAN